MNELRIQRVNFEPEYLIVEWVDDQRLRLKAGEVIVPASHRQLRIPLACFPRLHAATITQRNDWTLIGRGRGIHWESIDEDLSVENLLAAYSREKRNHYATAHV